jgi:hypothetical protein
MEVWWHAMVEPNWTDVSTHMNPSFRYCSEVWSINPQFHWIKSQKWNALGVWAITLYFSHDKMNFIAGSESNQWNNITLTDTHGGVSKTGEMINKSSLFLEHLYQPRRPNPILVQFFSTKGTCCSVVPLLYLYCYPHYAICVIFKNLSACH